MMTALMTPAARRCFPLFAQLVDAQEGGTLEQHGTALDAVLVAAVAVAAEGVGHELLLALQAAFRAGAGWAEQMRQPAFEDDAALRDAAMRLDDLLLTRQRWLADEAETAVRYAAA